MKRLALIITSLITVFLIIGCGGETAAQNSGFKYEKGYLWSESDIKMLEYEDGYGFTTSESFITESPINYKGAVPIHYVTYFPSDVFKPLAYIMDDRKATFFAYRKGSIVGAQTRSNGGTILAEATIVDSTDSGIVVEEYQYDSSGKVVFSCIDKFDPTGKRLAQTDIKGEGLGDYYFTWPSPNIYN